MEQFVATVFGIGLNSKTKDKIMKRYVIYLEEIENDYQSRIYFPCDADDPDHAEEQALNAYPNGNCITIFQEI